MVLSGGGSYGAYEVGVLRALEKAGLEPAILSGVSVGAINAVVWLAHGFKTAPLEHAWSELRSPSVGMRWPTLVLRAAGGLVATFCALQVLLTVVGSLDLGMGRAARILTGLDRGWITTLLEVSAWLMLGLLGFWIGMRSGAIDRALDRAIPADPDRLRHQIGVGLVVLGIVFLVVVGLQIPWPLRFHLSVFLVGLIAWFAMRPGSLRGVLRGLVQRLLPETGGRGLWRGTARRRLVRRLVAAGDPQRLVDGRTHVVVSACDVNRGTMSYFINWANPSAAFRRNIAKNLGEVVEVLTPRDVIEATVASGAVPVLFEPAHFRGRDYLDGGVFSNQPLHAVVADGADAILLVLVSPSSGPRRPSDDASLVELGARLQELANWRDLQTELRRLPAGWSREGDPAQVCVVEPREHLPGWMFAFGPAASADLVRRGERDAWRALDRAEWLEPPADGRAAKAAATKVLAATK